MKILIIGSKGFIGSHLSAFFKNQEHEVYNCDVVPSLDEKNYTQLVLTNSNFGQLFQEHSYDWCINASGNGNVGKSIENPLFDYQLNVANVFMLLNGIRKYNNSCKFLNFSSAAVYGNPTSLPISETDLIHPLSPYGFHKQISEQICKSFKVNFNIQTVSLRVFSAYGPGLRKQLIWDLYKKYQEHSSIQLYGTGNESRDFIYIDDLVQAVSCVIHNYSEEIDEVNVASGIETTINEVVTTYFNILDTDASFTFTGQNHTGYPHNWKANINQLQSLGFQSKVNLLSGLKKTVQWQKENG